MQQTSKTPVVQWVYANKQAPWHAGGQRFESAWLHFKNPLKQDFATVLGRGI